MPCAVVNLSEDAEKELNIRLNKNSGEWDWDMLANLFDMVDLVDWGFTADELNVSEDFVNSMSDLDFSEHDESFGYTFSVRCESLEDFENIQRVFKTNKKSIAYDEAQESLFPYMSDETDINRHDVSVVTEKN